MTRETSEDDILVIGAGPAGLATSACLRREGLPHVVVEREAAVASAWRRGYDRLHLHTTKRHSALPFAPWPEDAPEYPSRDEVVAYLERYAAAHGVAPRLGVTVQRLRRRGAGFEVETDRGPLAPRFVVVATGYNGAPNRPPLPGLASFDGPVVHTSQYRNAAPYAGRRTLVVGCGNSGAEIALDLAEHGVDVTMVVRGPVHVVPRDLFGRPSQHTGVQLARLPLAVRDALVGAVLRVAVGDLSRWGIRRPALGVNRLIEEHGRVPILDVGTIAKVKQGAIAVAPAVTEVRPREVRFADGSLRPVDAIILATGYATGLARLVEGFEAISDARGRPHRFGAETAIPGLFFVGFKNPSTGALREMALEAPRVAAALRAAARG